MRPGPRSSRDEALIDDIRARASSVFHPVEHLPHGAGSARRRGRCAPARARHRGPARRRRLGVSGRHVRQHQRARRSWWPSAATRHSCSADAANGAWHDRPALRAGRKLAPYWWERRAAPALPAAPVRRAVRRGDRRLRLHRAERGAADGARRPATRVVFDAEDAGFGCSTRNGGQISTSVKPSLRRARQRHGDASARSRSSRKASARSRGSGSSCARRASTATSRWRAASTPRTTRRSSPRSRAHAEHQPKGLEVDGAHGARARSSAARSTPTRTVAARIRRSTRRSIRRAITSGLLDRVRAAGAHAARALPGHRTSSTGRRRFRVTTARGVTLARDVVDRHRRLHGLAGAVAAAARDPHRQLHHRHRAAARGARSRGSCRATAS